MRKCLRQLAEAYPPSDAIRDTVTFGGLGMVGYGLHLIYPPAAYIVCGAVLFWLGARS